MTTTKQIETRVKRHVKFEDGKILEDSGPIVSTATTEDTDKVESEQTEVTASFLSRTEINRLTFNLNILFKQRKTLGEPPADVVDGPGALEYNKNAVNSASSLQPTKHVMAARDDGLVREEKENRVVSCEVSRACYRKDLFATILIKID